MGFATDERGQRLPFDVLHRDERRPFILADVVHRHDVLMPERRGGTCLAHETFVDLGGREIRENLQGDGAIQARIAGEIDGAHPAAADTFDDLIAAESFWRLAHVAFPSLPPASTSPRGTQLSDTTISRKGRKQLVTVPEGGRS